MAVDKFFDTPSLQPAQSEERFLSHLEAEDDMKNPMSLYYATFSHELVLLQERRRERERYLLVHEWLESQLPGGATDEMRVETAKSLIREG